MRKCAVIFVVLLLIVTSIFMVSCNKSEEITYVEKPIDSSLKMWLLDDYNKDELLKEDYVSEIGVSGQDVYFDIQDKNAENPWNEEGVAYIFSGNTDEYTLTQIRITDPCFKVYGLCMCSPVEAMKVNMEKYGYKFVSSVGAEPYVETEFKKGYVTVQFSHNAIKIIADTTNTSGLDY